MIKLNGKKFAASDTEFTNSLFENGGTCVGYYKRLQSKIKLFDMQKVLVGVITKHKVMAKASKLDNGKYWYSYGDIDLVGKYPSYLEHMKDIDKALAV